MVDLQVDFQFCMYTTPAYDVLALINTSVSDEVYDNHKITLIEEYHKFLCTTMKRVGCKTRPLDLEKFKQHLRDRAVLEMVYTFTFLPIFLAEKSDVLSVDEMMSQTTASTPGIKSPRFRKILCKRIPIFDEMGFFNDDLLRA